jgi:pimeloyl-ACP methyl ester carboxylesterase
MNASMKSARLFVCLMVLLTAIHLVPVARAQDASPVASDGSFAAAPCMVALPFGFTEGADAGCGWLTVPLKHENPTGPTIKLAVVHLKATGSNPVAEPLIFLNGGPGGSMATWPLPAFAQGYYSFAPLLERQDVIIFDQRGAGASQPALSCGLPASATTGGIAYPDVPACLRDLTQSGTDLTAFRTEENAADVDSLRSALGYQKVDLLGASYGTRLALEVMRDFPESIRSVVLSSPMPPEVDPFSGQLIGFNNALDAIFADCAADSGCDVAYPNLNESLETGFNRLNGVPAVVKAASQFGGGDAEITLDGPEYMAVIYSIVYSGLVSELPSLISQVSTGHYEALSPWLTLSQGLFSGLSLGDFYSTICQDEAPFSDRPTASDAAENTGVRSIFLNKKVQNLLWIGNLGICDAAALPSSPPDENEPVHSDIPTLIMTGEYDPITPPSNGELLMSDLSNATLINVSGQSHTQLQNGGACTVGIAAAFLADPLQSPSLACLDMIFPTFEVS